MADGKISDDPTASNLAGAFVPIIQGGMNKKAPASMFGSSSVYVEQFGAVGDGVADDAAAIQAAIDSGAREVWFLDNRYRIASTIDMTAMNGGGCKLKGMGRGEGTVGTQIIGETSGLMIDCTGSQYVEFEDLTLKPGASNKSTIGIMFARATTAQYAQFCAMTRVHIDIPTNTAANGGNGTIGVYNYAAELFNMIDCYFRADHPYVITANNVFSLSSSFVTIETGTWSTSHIQNYGCSYVSYAFAAVRLAGTVSHIAFDHMYALRVSGTYKYAIQIEGLTDGAHFDGNLEGFERAVYGTYTMTQMSFRFRVPGTNNESLIYLDGLPGNVPGLRSSHIDIFAWNVSTQHVIEQSATGQNGTSGCEIYLHGSQTLAIAGGYSTANIIKAGNNAAPTVTQSGATFYSGVLFYRGGQRLYSLTQLEKVAWVPKNLALSNGANGTITLPTDASIVRLTGPTAAFSIAGITAGVDGQMVVLLATVAFALTLLNEDGGTTAANRIVTPQQADIVARAGRATVTLYYNGTDSRWQVISVGALNGAVTGPTSTTDNTLPRFDGTAGALQASGVVVNDSNDVSGINQLSTTSNLNQSVAAGSSVGFQWQTAGSVRWQFLKNNAAEAGSNAGSNWEVARYSDAGAYLGSPIVVFRDTGRMTLERSLVVGAPTGGDKGAGTINATAVYDDNTLLTCMALQEEFLAAGEVDLDKWDALAPDLVVPERLQRVPVEEEVEVEEFVDEPIRSGKNKGALRRKAVRNRRRVQKVLRIPVLDASGKQVDEKIEPIFEEIVIPAQIIPRVHGTARLFADMLAEGFDPREPRQYIAKLRADQALPGMPDRSTWEHNSLSSGELFGRLWLATEMLAIVVMNHEARISALER